MASDSESDMDASDAEEDEEAEVTATKSEKQVKVTMKLIEQWSTKLRVSGPHIMAVVSWILAKMLSRMI